MVVNVRNGVFETNSSSMHTLAVKKNHRKETLEDMRNAPYSENMEDGVLYIYDFQLDLFERGDFNVVYSMFDKLNYLILYISHHCSRDDTIKWLKREVYEVIKEYYPKFKRIKLDNNIDFVIGNDCRKIESDNRPYIFDLFEDIGITVKEFLTDTAYQVFYDADNGIYTGCLIRAGIIHEEDYNKYYRV